ncbi:hypothetical protein ABZ883_12510 [Streptomyces sp. NPDC046977]|uniref:hypothetical protein n=1 Tax=Streptomyces sp. NPDC046977 TaxID=3154703 RepID=UPI0033D02CB5
MSEHPGKPSHERAIDVVRGYANHNAVAVRNALADLDPGGWTDVFGVLNGLLRSTIGIVELTGAEWNTGQLVRHADEVAAAAPPHYEFAVAEATRAWALGDVSPLRTFADGDLPAAVHITGVFVAVLGLALWGRAGFLDVVNRLDESAAALMNSPDSAIPTIRP